MGITVSTIARTLEISEKQALDMLAAIGVVVSDPKAVLTAQQQQQIKKAIEETKQQQAASNLAYYVNTHKLFIDTCSLLHFRIDQFLENITPLLQETGNQLIISTRVIDELVKHQGNPTNQELADKAKHGLLLLQKLQQQNLIEIRGEETDNFADNVFAVIFTKFRLSHRLLLITQDGNLAKDILSLNEVRSAKGHKVAVKRINKHGFLSNFYFNQDDLSQENQPDNSNVNESTGRVELASTITNIPANLLPVNYLPTEGDTVYTSKGPIQLVETIASGGEGTVYTTNTPYIAKIYKKEKINQAKYEKIKLMLSKKIEYPGICWPIDIIYNQEQTFVGYLMPKASGKELQRCLFIKPLLLKTFPHWKKRDTVELAITILDKIQYLHERNVILGDINPMNILIVSPTEVYFVDTDSYQIEGFPCPVGTVIYTAPEIQGKTYTDFLRSFGNEYFAIATLLFMIMLPGKPPYSQQGGESLSDNIINMDFSYPLGEQSNKKTPEGPWRYIWSHMPYYIKEAFYKTFRKGEEYSTEDRRLPPNDWRDKFAHYLELLDSGKYAQQDELSLELFPNRFKKIGGMTYIRCKLCHKEILEGQDQNGICRDCLMKGEVYRCSRCDREMIFTNFAKYFKQSKRHEVCPDCYNYLNETHSRVHCVDCGRLFTITNGEYEHYTSKELALPKRCQDCRRRRQNNYSSALEAYYNSPAKRGLLGYIRSIFD